jgi:hypothetical protein
MLQNISLAILRTGSEGSAPLSVLAAEGKAFKLNAGNSSFYRVNYTQKQWAALVPVGTSLRTSLDFSSAEC